MKAAESWRPWAEMSPPEHIQAIEALIARGCTSTVIANQLETTRNAVCGCCARNGLTLPGTQVGGPVNLARPKNERSAAGGHATRKAAGVTLAGPAARPHAGDEIPTGSHGGGAAPESPEGNTSPRSASPKPTAVASAVGFSFADASAPPAEGLGFFDLKAEHCRRPLWGPVRPPLDELLYCGARAVVGTSYCRACTARLTAPTPGLIRQRNRAYGDTRASGAGPLPTSPARGEGSPAARPANPTADCRLPTAAPQVQP